MIAKYEFRAQSFIVIHLSEVDVADRRTTLRQANAQLKEAA
jgi:hypothetical protein